MSAVKSRTRFHLSSWIVALACLAFASTASAAGEMQVESFEAGLSSYQASGHADQVTSFRFATEPQPGNCLIPEADCVVVKGGATKDVSVLLPKGLVGNANLVPQCELRDLSSLKCPVTSQVGHVTLGLLIGGWKIPAAPEPVYNLAPERGEVAKLGFRAFGVANILVSLKVSAEDGYAVRADSENIFTGTPLYGLDMTIWGNPWAEENDSLRICNSVPGCKAGLAPKPFLAAPARCGVEDFARLKTRSYQHPTEADWVNAQSMPQQMSGCEKLRFDPSLRAEPSESSADSPSGLDVTLRIPQRFDNPQGLETPPLRRAEVLLPAGVSLNSSSADGLSGCSMEEIGIAADGTANGEPVRCPLAAKIGDVQATTPVLGEALGGAVYLATPHQNPFGSLLAIYLVVENRERGILVKVPGKVSVDPVSGQLTAVFDDNPQLPVEELGVELNSGPRAPLRLPSACGTYETRYALTSWSGQRAEGTSSFTIDQGCGKESKFTPGFQAGTTNPIAAEHSPFTLRVTRPDGQQNVASIATTLPEGVLAKLAGVPLCPEASASSGSCPQASQIGTTTVGAGAGPTPLYVPQPGKAPTAVYLAGPYKGAPYSLVVKVPAQAGPFDLGTVTVRNTIEVNPTTAQVSVKSDPLPQILQGIPIAYRDIRVDVDKQGFTLNPTSCDPMQVKGTIGSAQGTEAKVAGRFQAASCERLAFKPDLKLSVKGPTHRSAHPRFKAVLTMPKGGANIEKAQVTLPKTEFLENAHIRTICTRVQYNAGKGGGAQCPPASVYGYARAWSPLLDQPLQGPVFLRSSNNPLPDLIASLDGQIHVDLVGRIDAVNARIRNTFESVPDAPVSKFVLEMQGGKKGLLVNNTELCKTVPRATVKFDGQNGKVSDSAPVMRADCGKKKRGKKK